MNNVTLTLLIDDKHVAHLEKIQRRLGMLGMTNMRGLRNLGVITGQIDDSLIRKIAALPEVTSVEQERVVQIAPPLATVQ